MNRQLLLLLTLLFTLNLSSVARPLRILSIGNSFSEDAVEQDLHSLVSMGGHEIIIGNLYYPACDLQRHWKNLKSNKGEYSYRKILVNGKADTIPNCTMGYALRDEAWDIITFQQGSAVSGVYSTFRFLPNILKRIREIVGNRTKFYWHQTWAYAPDSKHKAFKTYSNDQYRMYASILYCTRKVMKDNSELTGLIPTGTAIQDARTALGANLTRDGHHLDLVTGRFIASTTWYKTLFPTAHLMATYIPKGMTREEVAICQKAALEAIAHPYEIIDLGEEDLIESSDELHKSEQVTIPHHTSK